MARRTTFHRDFREELDGGSAPPRIRATMPIVVVADYRQNEDIAQFLGLIDTAAIIGKIDKSGFRCDTRHGPTEAIAAIGVRRAGNSHHMTEAGQLPAGILVFLE